MTYTVRRCTAVTVAAAALLLALPSTMRAQPALSAPSLSNGSSANEGATGAFDNPSWQRFSNTQTLSSNATSFQTRYFGNASADCGPACGSRTETLGTNYTVSWTVTGGNLYRVQVDTRRTAGLTIGDDGSDGAQATMNAVACTPSGGTAVSGGCTLADPADNTSGSTSDVNVNQTTSFVRCGQALGGPVNHSVNFTWSQTAFTPSTGFVQINMDEAAVRLGAPNLDGANGAANYPGTGGRTQANDGHFVTVTLTNLCGNAVIDVCGAASEQCDDGVNNGTINSCCTTNCTFKTGGSACTDNLFCNGTDTCNGIANSCSNHTGDPCLVNVGDADTDCSESCNEATDSCTASDPNGSFCSDGLFCSGPDSCSGGNCVASGNPCPGHNVGPNCNDSCDEGADNCLADDANGTSCPGNGTGDCSGADSCNSGTCSDNDFIAGTPCPDSSPPASGNCQDAQCNGSGTCDQNFANEGDGTACDDGLFCTATDTCQAGSCDGAGDPCPGPDNDTDCSESCDEGADDCSANDADGTTCRPDAGDCDVVETCSSGTCPADAFEDVGTTCGSGVDTDCTNPDSCDGSGTCLANDETSGTTCGNQVDDDCTDPDSCDGSGTCESNDETAGTGCGDPSDTDCSNPDTCNGSGICNVNNEADGTTCGDPSDTDCDNPDACLTGSCDANNEDAGEPCGDPSDTDCDNPDACDGAGQCGVNQEVAGTPCTDDGEICTEDECNGSGTCDHPAGNASVECRGTTTGDTCDEAEVCDGTNPTCPADGVKDAGESCRAPADDCDAEETCDGITANCPADDVEDSGTPCRPAAGDCDVEEQCDGVSAACPADGFEPDGTTCNDGQFCTATDTCDGGDCSGTGSPCGAESCDESSDTCFTGQCPELPSTCRGAVKTQLLIKKKDDPAKNKLLFKWIKGDPTLQTELADPIATATYALCIYDNSGLLTSATVPPSGSWIQVGTKGYKYIDNSGMADGVQRILVKGSDQSKSKALVKGKGSGLPVFTLPFPEASLPITAQLRNNQTGVCFTGEFATPKKNTESLFKAKNP